MEVDVDASEVEQVVYLCRLSSTRSTLQWPDKKGGLWSVWVKFEYSDGSRTNRYVRSEFLGDSEEGLHLL